MYKLKVIDEIGEITLDYEEMKKYHGKDYWGGLALSFKVLELAFKKLGDGKVPRRDKIRVVTALNAPGVMDGLEYITRAVSDKRITIDLSIGKGLIAPSGKFYFEVYYGNKKKITVWLKDGFLPEGFVELAKKCRNGSADEKEITRWKDLKKEIGCLIIKKNPQEILEIGEIVA